MRTVLITPSWQVSIWNKVARLSESIARALCALGRDVQVITPQISNGGARRRWVDGIHIMEVDDNPRGSWKENAKQALDTLRNVSEIVVVDSAAYQVVKEYKNKIPIIGVVLFGQSTQGERIASSKTDALVEEENELIRDCDTLLVNNEILKNRIEQEFSREVHKLEMAASIPPEVDILFGRDNVQKRECEVVVVGKIGPELGLEKVLRAMPNIPWLKLKAIGMPRNEWEQNRMRGLIQRLRIQDRVTFTGWARTREVLTAIQEAEILVAPSQVEYFGYSVMDSMLMGTPVVASTANIHIELISDSEDGILFQNLQELEVALNSLHETKELREIYAQKCLKKIEESRSLDIMAYSLADVLGV